MPGISIRASLGLAICLAACVTGCTTVRGPDGEKALWSTVTTGPGKPKKLNDPIGLTIAYARLQEELGQAGEARQAYRAVLEDEPKSVEAILGIARLDQLAGRSQEAESGIQKAMLLKPSDPMVMHAAGQFYASKNEWNKAGDLLSKAMMAEPENKAYCHDFAIVLARSGRVDQAMPHFVRAVGEAEAHYNVAFILYQQGNLDLAEQHLVQALGKQRDLKQAKSLLADIRNVKEDRAALAENAAAPNGVSPASHTVIRSESHGLRRTADGSVVPAINARQVPSAGNSSGQFAMPSQAPPQSPVQYEQVEQWNNQRGVW